MPGHTFRYNAPVRAKMPLNPLIFLVSLKDLAAFWHVREQYTGICDHSISLNFMHISVFNRFSANLIFARKKKMGIL